MSKKSLPEGWQRRFVDPPYSTQWVECDYKDVLRLVGARGHEFRPLYPGDAVTTLDQLYAVLGNARPR
ncbi:MAG: hypothetical protein IT480_08550 [Gammaproteobacteria bacterium]|nr:hypothetical protein [Gammaproteobacteria bacterium]